MSQISDVKAVIKTKLDTLVGNGLGSVLETDLKHDPLDMEVHTYPAAFLMPPAIAASDRLDNVSVVRDLTFTIMVVEQADNINSATQIENLMQSLVDLFDQSITLGNTAVAGLKPTTSFPEPFIHNGRSLVVFDIILTARTLTTLTYS